MKEIRINPKIEGDQNITSSSVLQKLGNLINNEKYADIAFICGKVKYKIYANKCILGSQSVVFESLLFGDQNALEIAQEDIEPEHFLTLLNFLYGQEIIINGNNCLHVLYACKQYEVTDLADHCIDYLKNCLTLDTVLDILTGAYKYNEQRLMKKCIKIIEKNTVKVLSSSKFSFISEEILSYILQCDHLNISEIDLFKFVHQWGKDNEGNFKPLKYIRLGLMSSKEIFNIVKPLNVIPLEDYIEAIEFNIDPLKFDRTLTKFKLREPRRYQFVFSKKMFGQKVVISKDRRTAQCVSSLFSIICCKPRFESGKHHWRIKIIQGDGVGIGIVKSNVNIDDLTGFHLGNKIGYSFHSHGKIISEPNNSHREYKSTYKVGDIIGVTLDLENGKLSFTKNGVDLGVAFNNLSGSFRPAISLALSTVEIL